MKNFALIISLILFINTNAQIDNIAEKLGFEKVIIKNESMKCHFMPSDKEAYFQSETFGKIIAFIQQHPKRCKMKEYKTRLILKIDEVLTVNEAKDWLTKMLE